MRRAQPAAAAAAATVVVGKEETRNGDIVIIRQDGSNFVGTSIRNKSTKNTKTTPYCSRVVFYGKRILLSLIPLALFRNILHAQMELVSSLALYEDIELDVLSYYHNQTLRQQPLPCTPVEPNNQHTAPDDDDDVDVVCFRKMEETKNGSSSSVCNRSTTSVVLPRFPDFIIAGTQKGGTTALQRMLLLHPNILSARFTRYNNVTQITPEPHFWDLLRKKTLPRNGTEFTRDKICSYRFNYSKFFDLDSFFLKKDNHHRPTTTISFEKTPSYMVYPHLPFLIYNVIPWTKIIILLRNPVDRWFSEFEMEFLLFNQDNTKQTIRNNNHTMDAVFLQQLEDLRNANILIDNPVQSSSYTRFMERVNEWQSKLSQWETTKDIPNNNQKDNTTLVTLRTRRLFVDERNNQNNRTSAANLKTNVPSSATLLETIQKSRRTANRGVLLSSLHRGMYVYQIMDWMNYFPLWNAKNKNDDDDDNDNNTTTKKRTLMILQYEKFKQRPLEYLKQIQSFLGLSEYYNYTLEEATADYGFVRNLRPNKERQLKQLYEETGKEIKELLQLFYKPYNDQLATLLGEEEWKDVWD